MPSSRRIIDLPTAPKMNGSGSLVPDNESQRKAELFKRLDARRFDFENPPARPVPLFTIRGKSILTRGNIGAEQAQSKAGKTTFNSALMAAWMAPGEEFLGVTADENASGAIVHFDCEQSPFDHWNVCANAMRRAGITRKPDKLRSYYLTDLPLKDRKDAFRLELERARDEAGSVFAVFLDGIADLCIDPNDSEEAFALVAEVHRLAIEFNTGIFCVLHENEGNSEQAKMRGHLGSQLARKAETNLRLCKDSDGVTVVFTERSRHCHIPKDEGPRFAWSEEHGMHISVGSGAAGKATAKLSSFKTSLDEIFREANAGGMTRKEILAALCDLEMLKPEGARTRFDKMRAAGALKETTDGKWQSHV